MEKILAGRQKGIIRGAIVLLVIGFWGGYLWHNWDHFLAYRWQLDFTSLALSCLAGAAYWVMFAVIWRRVLLSVGGSLGLFAAVRLWTMSMLARYVPGGVWHIAGRVYLAEEAGESGLAVFISTIIEQILALLAALLLLLVSLAFWDADFARFAPILLLAVPLALAVHPSFLRRLTSLATRFAKGKVGPSGAAADRPVTNIWDSLPIPGYRLLLLLLLLYVLPNLLAAASLYLAAAAVGTVLPGQLPAFAGAYAVGWLVGYFSFFAPSGLGVREGATALLLTPIVGAPVAIAASVLSRLAMSLGEAIVVGVVWGSEARGKRKANEHVGANERVGTNKRRG